jgi:serine/threonine protein phosphatase PrpC
MPGKRKADTLSVTETDKMPSLLDVFQEQRRGNMDRYKMCLIGDIEYYAVFDGNGSGSVAKYLWENLHVKLAEKLGGLDLEKESSVKKAIKAAFHEMETEIDAKFNLEDFKSAQDISGSTATVALIKGSRCYLAHCGDSPAVFQSMKGLRYDAAPHCFTNKKEVKRVGTQSLVGDRLFGVMLPFRGFGAPDLKTKPEHKDSKGNFFYNATPEIWTCHEPGLVLIASDGLTEYMPNGDKIDMGLTVGEMVDQAKRREFIPMFGPARKTTDDITIIKMMTRI